jgi:hypothetical protein
MHRPRQAASRPIASAASTSGVSMTRLPIAKPSTPSSSKQPNKPARKAAPRPRKRIRMQHRHRPRIRQNPRRRADPAPHAQLGPRQRRSPRRARRLPRRLRSNAQRPHRPLPRKVRRRQARHKKWLRMGCRRPGPARLDAQFKALQEDPAIATQSASKLTGPAAAHPKPPHASAGPA